jgi:hypothetical protein
MHPHLSTAHSDRAWNDDGTLSWGVILDLLFVIFKGTVETLWDKGGGEGDTSDLSAEVKALYLNEEGVGDDLVVEISCEVDLDLSSSLDI